MGGSHSPANRELGRPGQDPSFPGPLTMSILRSARSAGFLMRLRKQGRWSVGQNHPLRPGTEDAEGGPHPYQTDPQQLDRQTAHLRSRAAGTANGSREVVLRAPRGVRSSHLPAQGPVRVRPHCLPPPQLRLQVTWSPGSSSPPQSLHSSAPHRIPGNWFPGVGTA